MEIRRMRKRNHSSPLAPAQPDDGYRSRDGRIELHCGDALTRLVAMPAESVDALITDPPYSSGGFSLSAKAASTGAKYCNSGRKYPTFSGDAKSERAWLGWAALWLFQCHRIMRPGGYAFVFIDWRMLATATDAIQAGGFIFRGIIAWDKGAGARAPHKGYVKHQCEYLVWGTKGSLPKAVHGGPWPGCYRHTVIPREKLHLTGKPLPLMRELVRITKPGSLILDPFAGSGTTLLAAVKERRRAIGFELSPEYFQIAVKRLSEAADG